MVEINITEIIDKKILNIFRQSETYSELPFSVEELRNCIIMFILKDLYHSTESKYSLRKHRKYDDADDIRMRDSRNMEYVQHYRKLQYEQIKYNLGIEIDELRVKNFETIERKIEGYKLTSMQYFELKNIEKYPLLKAIINKRICDVKKISNAVFREYMKEYGSLVDELIKKLDGSDDDVIFGTIALFTLEWKYNVEFFYSCTINAEKVKTQEVPINRLASLCANVSIPLTQDCTQTFSTESRFILNRLKLVHNIYNSSEFNWIEIENKICDYLRVCYYIKPEQVDELCMLKITTRKQWADFFRKHYNLKEIYVKKEWSNKRIRYMRNTYDIIY